MKRIILTVLCFILIACNKSPQKTESMIRFEHTQHEQKELVSKATAILEADVANDPINNLSDLLYVRELSIQAADVYKNANIVGIEQPNLIELQQKLAEFRPLLAKHAITLLSHIGKKTIALKEQLYDLKSQSYAAAQQAGGSNVASYLGSKYNQDIQTCCLKTLSEIRIFLRGTGQISLQDDTQEKYIHLNKLIKNVTSDQEDILYKVDKGKAYEAKLLKLQQTFNDSLQG